MAAKRKPLDPVEADAAHLAREERERERATISVRLDWLKPYVAEAAALEQRLKQIEE